MSYCKLDLSILDNFRYGSLSDHFWRRLIEFYILACEIDKNGELPPLELICWYLHNTHDKQSIQNDIDVLLDREFLTIVDSNGPKISVRNYDAIVATTTSSTERVRRYRERKVANGCTGFDAEAIKRRDDYKCVYCGSTEELCVDHIYPVIQGGSDDYNNLACACKKCNSGKGGQTPLQAGMSFLNPLAEERYQIYLEDGL